MRDFVIRKLIEWLANNLTKELLEEWAEKAKQYLFPKLREYADELVDKLRDEAKKTDNNLDDTLVDAFAEFVDALLPDNPKVLQ